VEGDVKDVAGRGKVHPWWGEFGAAHLDSELRLETFYLDVIVGTPGPVLHFQSFEGHEQLLTRWSRDSKVAVVVGRVAGRVVRRRERGDGHRLSQPDVITRILRRWSCCSPENSTETEFVT